MGNEASTAADPAQAGHDQVPARAVRFSCRAAARGALTRWVRRRRAASTASCRSRCWCVEAYGAATASPASTGSRGAGRRQVSAARGGGCSPCSLLLTDALRAAQPSRPRARGHARSRRSARPRRGRGIRRRPACMHCGHNRTIPQAARTSSASTRATRAGAPVRR